MSLLPNVIVQLKSDSGVTAGDGHPPKVLPMTRALTLGPEAGSKSRVYCVLRFGNANSFPSSGPMVEKKKKLFCEQHHYLYISNIPEPYIYRKTVRFQSFILVAVALQCRF